MSLVNSEYLIDEAENTRFIGYLYFTSALLEIKNNANNVEKIKEYYKSNSNYKMAIDTTLTSLIRKIKKAEKFAISGRKKSKDGSIKKFYNRNGNNIISYTLEKYNENLFEITQKLVTTNPLGKEEDLSYAKGAERFIIIPDFKKIAFLEHSENNKREFDKCFLMSYHIKKNKLFLEPFEGHTQCIIDEYGKNISGIQVYIGNDGLLYIYPSDRLYSYCPKFLLS